MIKSPLRKKGIVLTEEQECELLADHLRLLQTQGKIQMFTHIPNSTYTTSWTQKRKNKRLGVSPGVPDYLIVFKTTLLFIEMKRQEKGVVSVAQHEWLDALANIVNVHSCVCLGFSEAKKIIDALI